VQDEFVQGTMPDIHFPQANRLVQDSGVSFLYVYWWRRLSVLVVAPQCTGGGGLVYWWRRLSVLVAAA